MASLTVTLRAETDLLQDAFDDIERIFLLLARRHGPQFRSLERRIEALMDGEVSAPIMHPLGPCLWLLAPPAEMTAIIRDARAIGVI